MPKSYDNDIFLWTGEIDATAASIPDARAQYAKFDTNFPKLLDSYAFTFKDRFETSLPEDQKRFQAALFAGTIAQTIYAPTIQREMALFRQKEDRTDNDFPDYTDISLSLADFTQNILMSVGVDDTKREIADVQNLYAYNRPVKQAFLTADNRRVIIDPLMMILSRYSDLVPSGLFQRRENEDPQYRVEGSGVTYVGLDFHTRGYFVPPRKEK